MQGLDLRESGVNPGQYLLLSVDVSTREGERLVVTLGNSVTAGRKTFLALNGNSYYVSLIPGEERQAQGYMTNDRSGTLTGGITISGAVPMDGDYIVTLPEDAEVFIGKKFSHFTNYYWLNISTKKPALLFGLR